MKFYWNKELKGQMHKGPFLLEVPKRSPRKPRIILNHLEYFYLYGISICGNFIGYIRKPGGRAI